MIDFIRSTNSDHKLQSFLTYLTYINIMTNKDELFDIAPPENVGTEILDPTMPSNLDFELPEISNNPKQPQQHPPHPDPLAIDPNAPDSLPIKSYSMKGHTEFNIPPKYPIGSIAPVDTNTFLVYDLSEEERSSGLWGIWESILGYVKRQMVIQDGYIYLLRRQKNGLLSVGHWRLVDLFKVFVDPEDSEVRLVLQVEGSSQLTMRDFRSDQLSNIVARLRESAKNLGLSMDG